MNEEQLYRVPKKGEIIPPGALAKHHPTGDLVESTQAGKPYRPDCDHTLHVVPVKIDGDLGILESSHRTPRKP